MVASSLAVTVGHADMSPRFPIQRTSIPGSSFLIVSMLRPFPYRQQGGTAKSASLKETKQVRGGRGGLPRVPARWPCGAISR
jgi:hypothetical protein